MAMAGLAQPMRPRERVLAALAGQHLDRPAAVSPTSIATVSLMNKTGAHFPAAHRDAETMATLAETAFTDVGFDTIMPVFSVVQESAALGCQVDWGSQSNWPTCVGALARSAGEIRIPADILNSPTHAACSKRSPC